MIIGSIPVDYAALRKAIAFEQRSVTVYGKTYPQPRLTKWYGFVPYMYSGLTWPACRMPQLLVELAIKAREMTGGRFNSVLCNLYRDGNDGVGWHSDDEALFGLDPDVGSLSYGATRDFKVRRKDNHKVIQTFQLKEGDLLYMPAGFQREWQHTIPTTKKPVGERINLTFRRTV